MTSFLEMATRISVLYDLNPPATPEQLATADRVFREEFGIPMPDDYRELLTISNGIEFNGGTFYASEESETPDGDFVLGLGESNENLIRGGYEIDTTLRFVGESGDRLYAYDTADATWKLVDRIGWDPDSPDDLFPTFTAMFTRVYEILVDW